MLIFRQLYIYSIFNRQRVYYFKVIFSTKTLDAFELPNKIGRGNSITHNFVQGVLKKIARTHSHLIVNPSTNTVGF